MMALAHGKADAVRKEAAKLQAKLDTHLAERGKLLAALEDFAVCKFEVACRPIIPPGQVFISGDTAKMPPVPLALRMEWEVKKLLADADRIEGSATQNTEGGRVSGSTLGDLLAVCENPQLLTPARAAIEAWYADVTARADTAWANTMEDYLRGGGPAPWREVVYTLVWDADGNIDPRTSSAVNREVRAVVAFHGGGKAA